LDVYLAALSKDRHAGDHYVAGVGGEFFAGLEVEREV
jgi:hypothetical protein